MSVRAWLRSLRPACVVCGHTGSRRNPVWRTHIIPRSSGGTDTTDNLRPMCLVHFDQRRPHPLASGLTW